MCSELHQGLPYGWQIIFYLYLQCTLTPDQTIHWLVEVFSLATEITENR